MSECCVQEVIKFKGQIVKFKRGLQGVLLQEWHFILDLIQKHTLSNEPDLPLWRWDSKKQFTTHSLYEFLAFRGIQQQNAMLWWSLPIPHKIKIFMWLLFKNKILTKAVLQHRGWQGCNLCQFCTGADREETAEHLFLKCPFVFKIWFWMGGIQDILYAWQSLDDILLYAMSLPSDEQQAFLVVVSAICWSIWKNRNAVCFDDKSSLSVRQIIMLICSLLNYWSGNIKRQVMQHIHLWTPVDMDMIPLQSISPQELDEFEEDAGLRVPVVPLLLE